MKIHDKITITTKYNMQSTHKLLVNGGRRWHVTNFGNVLIKSTSFIELLQG